MAADATGDTSLHEVGLTTAVPLSDRIALGVTQRYVDYNDTPAPDVSESEGTGSFRLLSLDALVRMKLTSFRDKDRVHLRDMIGVGLIDPSWIERLPATLKARLQGLLDNPEG